MNFPAATPAEIIVDAHIIDAPQKEIELDIDLNGVFLATNGNFHWGNRDLTVAGGLTADMHASAQVTLGVLPDGSISAIVSNVTAEVGPLVPQFTGPNANELDGLIIVGNNHFRQFVQSMIPSQLIPTCTNKIPPRPPDRLS